MATVAPALYIQKKASSVPFPIVEAPAAWVITRAAATHSGSSPPMRMMWPWDRRRSMVASHRSSGGTSTRARPVRSASGIRRGAGP
jgi:hypothetical protein